MTIVEKAITDLLSLQLADAQFLKCLRRKANELRKSIDESAVSRALSDLFPFFEDSQCKMLVAYLQWHYERHNNHPALNQLLHKYNQEGVLVLSNTMGVFKVVHCNNKLYSREKNPIQVSHWHLERGVCGDSIYQSFEQAVKSEGLLSMAVVVDDLDEIQDKLVNAECEYQERYKECFGEYRLS